MNYTSAYGLNMPEADEYVDISDLNQNAETIDTALFEINSKIDEVSKATGVVAKDETNSVDYLVKIKLVDGKPVIECTEK